MDGNITQMNVMLQLYQYEKSGTSCTKRFVKF